MGGLKLDLPLDDEDYLMPSPQQIQGATAYVDLIGEAKASGTTTSLFYIFGICNNQDQFVN